MVPWSKGGLIWSGATVQRWVEGLGFGHGVSPHCPLGLLDPPSLAWAPALGIL